MSPARAVILAAAISLAACGTSSRPAAAPPPGPCVRVAVPPAAAGGPTALLHDVAAPQTEFLLGWAGSESFAVMGAPDMYGSPAPFGHGVVFSRYIGGSAQVWGGASGACATKLSNGTIEAADPKGGAVVVTNGSWHHLVDGRGRVVADLGAGVFAWSYGGLLADADAKGKIAVYSASGHVLRRVSGVAGYPVGALGPTSILVRGAASLAAVDLNSGTTTDLGLATAYISAGSPSGELLAYSDAVHPPVLRRLGDRSETPLPAGGPVTGFSWSADSRWLGIASVYGGHLYDLQGGTSQPLGSLTVVAWFG